MHLEEKVYSMTSPVLTIQFSECSIRECIMGIVIIGTLTKANLFMTINYCGVIVQLCDYTTPTSLFVWARSHPNKLFISKTKGHVELHN